MTATTEDKSDDLERNFYMELEKIFSQFPKYWTNIIWRDFNANLKKDNNFTQNIWSVYT
jgi:hypothetical protein